MVEFFTQPRQRYYYSTSPTKCLARERRLGGEKREAMALSITIASPHPSHTPGGSTSER